jgi:hypothetical protein
MRMTETARRLSELELRADLLDGGEVQNREATLAVMGLLVRFLAREKVLDSDGLRSFLAQSVSSDLSEEDHVGQMISEFGQVVKFHQLDEAGLAPVHVPVDQLLTKKEMAEVRQHAATALALSSPSRN